MTTKIVADACYLINLTASEQELRIAEVLDTKLIIASSIRREVTCHWGPPDENGDPTRLPIDLSLLEKAGFLQTMDLPAAASHHLVRCAELLRDNDAAVLALAAHMHLPLVTDDGKLRRSANKLYPAVEIRSTLGEFHLACTRLKLSKTEVTRILRALSTKGRFLPPKNDPYRQWFMDHM